MKPNEGNGVAPDVQDAAAFPSANVTTWWRVTRWDSIDAVSVIKQTASTITTVETTMMGRPSKSRQHRIHGSDDYFPTWAEARDMLLTRLQRNIDHLKDRLQRVRSEAGSLRALKDPTQGIRDAAAPSVGRDVSETKGG